GLVARAGDEDDASLRIGGEILEVVAQRFGVLHVERVHGIRPVDGHGCDAAVTYDVDAHRVTGTRSRRKSTISETGAPGVKTSATPCRFSSSTPAFGIGPPTTT